MRIACILICQVTPKGEKPFEVAIYDARAYEGVKEFKVEWKLKIVRVTNDEAMEEIETLKESQFFQKETNLRADTIRSISFGGTTFSYSEKQDRIFIDRNYDIV